VLFYLKNKYLNNYNWCFLRAVNQIAILELVERLYITPLALSWLKKGQIYIINEYLKYEYSLIPIDSEKKPYIYWKSYQYKKANIEDIFDWCNRFSDINIGIVTGDISKLAVIDVDDLNLLPELKEFLPEAERTTKVRTPRGYHFYFSSNGNNIRTTNNFLGMKVELKYNGCYIVASPSVINGSQYLLEIPLSKMLPLPEIVLNKKDKKDGYSTKKVVEPKQSRNIKFRNKSKVACISQIIDRNLQVGGTR